MLELACREAVFHFNKAHIKDPQIPMWVVKAKGNSYYVDHVECNVPWSTKETSDNPHTKGSIKIKRCIIRIGEDNCAVIDNLSEEDALRLNKKRVPLRIITSYGAKLREALAYNAIAHGPIRSYGGGCSTQWFVTELEDQDDLPQLMLGWSGGNLRALVANEYYYKEYKPGEYTYYTSQFSKPTAKIIDEEDDEEIEATDGEEFEHY